MPSTITESTASMARGDHACLVYATDDERVAAAAGFVRAGLAAREKVVLIGEADGDERLARRLAADGLDAAAAIASGQLELRRADDAYLADGAFAPDQMLQLLRDDVARARDAGYAGYRVAGEMGWAAARDDCRDALLDYEARVDATLRAAGATGLCQYDCARFGARALREVASVHPLVLAAGEDGPCTLLVERAPGGELVLRGEVDSLCRASLETSLAAAADRGLDVRLDLSGLRFIDAAGVCALAEASARVRDGGGRLALVSAPRIVRRVAALTGLEPLLELAEATG